jgi:predicted O-methyltransferase YrrM
MPGVLSGIVRNAVRNPRAARDLLFKQVWMDVKRFAAPNILNIDTVDVEGLADIVVMGMAKRPDSLVLCSLCKLLGCRTVFEIGTFQGDTAWLLAHNDPALRVFTLDLPDLDRAGRTSFELTDPEYFASWERGVRFQGTPEGDRITQLLGDSAAFDYAPFAGAVDLVFIDASHNYSYVRSDTEAALGMLSSRGAIVWDDYTHYPGIYAYLNELASTLDRPIMHLLGTRFALYSRRELVRTS